MKKLRVGILGGTGMVGQRFITLLAHHPWFTVSVIAASLRSKGKKYNEAVKDKWKMQEKIPDSAANIVVLSVTTDYAAIAKQVDLVFCALDMEKSEIQRIEELYAGLGIPVISNNSAHRWTEDIPMIIPEVNENHLDIITQQKKRHGWKKGFIVVKPNCSIQSYVVILTALKAYKPEKIHVTSLQAISGAGKNFTSWPEMVDNVIPFIGGEEEKSENEPMKIWGEIQRGKIIPARNPVISATCIRVAVSDGHMASVSVSFGKKPELHEVLAAINDFNNTNPLSALSLPSSPQQVITYLEDENRPQTKLDRITGQGMGILMGRWRTGKLFDNSFVTLSHNTIRGAAGGAVLTAELLVKKGYIQ